MANIPSASSFPQHSKELSRQLQARHYEHSAARIAARPVRTRTELDVLKEKHRFIREERPSGKDAEPLSWEDELAERWYSKLFREIDLKHYKTGKIAMRWRLEDEVVAELGERTCGNLRCDFHYPAPDEDLARFRRRNSGQPSISERRPENRENRRRDDHPSSSRSFYQREPEIDEDEESPLVTTSLEPYQLNFAYEEAGKVSQALVKVILCKKCAKRLVKGRQAAKEAASAGTQQ